MAVHVGLFNRRIHTHSHSHTLTHSFVQVRKLKEGKKSVCGFVHTDEKYTVVFLLLLYLLEKTEWVLVLVFRERGGGFLLPPSNPHLLSIRTL